MEVRVYKDTVRAASGFRLCRAQSSGLGVWGGASGLRNRVVFRRVGLWF